MAALTVKGRGPKTGYDRESFRFGNDVDGNGCETRDDILARDLTNRVVLGDECTTETGTLNDPYSGHSIDFGLGATSVDIDHVVALGDAWVTGAFLWDGGKRAALANDPLNLLAVHASLDRQKGDGDAATWLPPRKTYRCAYVARQIAVKSKYHLWVKPAEGSAMGRILSGCPAQTLPVDSTLRPTAPIGTSQPEPPRVGEPPITGPFANCDEARAAGAAPVHRGQAGYAPHLDRDNDGIGCDN